MAKIDSLSILLKAQVSPFITGMKKAQRMFKSAIGSAAKLASGIGVIGAALTGISGFSLGTIFKDTLKEADRVGKLSDEIGITVNALWGLQHAAEISGTSMEVLVRGLQRMNRRIGEASLGYGEGAKALDQLGIGMDELMGKSADEQFLRIADSVNELNTQSEKAAAVYALFGRQGQFLLNTFQLQRDGIKSLIKESEKLIGTYNRDEFRVFEELNDSVLRLKTSIKGFALGLGKELATKLVAGITLLTNVIVELREKHLPALATKFREFLTGSITLIRDNAEFFATMAWVVIALSEGFLQLGVNAAKGLGVIAEGLADVHNLLTGVLARMGYWEHEQLNFLQILARSVRGLGALFTFIVSTVQSTIQALGNTVGLVILALAKLVSKLPGRDRHFGKGFKATSLKEMANQFNIVGDMADDTTAAYNKMLDAFDDNKGGKIIGDMKKWIEEASKQMLEFNLEAKIKNAMSDFSQAAGDLTNSVEKLTSAMTMGSQAALATIARATMGARGANTDAAAAATFPNRFAMEAQSPVGDKAELQKQTRVMEQIRDNLGFVVPGVPADRSGIPGLNVKVL